MSKPSKMMKCHYSKMMKCRNLQAGDLYSLKTTSHSVINTARNPKFYCKFIVTVYKTSPHNIPFQNELTEADSFNSKSRPTKNLLSGPYNTKTPLKTEGGASLKSSHSHLRNLDV